MNVSRQTGHLREDVEGLWVRFTADRGSGLVDEGGVVRGDEGLIGESVRSIVVLWPDLRARAESNIALASVGSSGGTAARSSSLRLSFGGEGIGLL